MSRRGNISLIAALTLLPTIMALGGAVDFGLSLSNRNVMQDASDAAALAGAQAANAYLTQNGTGATQQAQAILVGNATAKSVYNANLYSLGTVSAPTFVATTTITSNAPSTSVAATGTYTPFLLKIAGVSSVPLSANAISTMSPSNSYYQIIFVVDVSASMGIGADAATISTMQSTPAFNDVNNLSCAFACHDSNNLQGVTASSWCDTHPLDAFCKGGGRYYCPWGSGQCGLPVASKTYSDTRALARTYGYKLKIDYVNSAISTFMTQLSTYSSKYPGRYTVAIDTFGSNADGNQNWFYQLQTPTTNMTTAAAAAGAIDIETYPVLWGGYTYTTNALTSALAKITNKGDGSSPTKMLTYVIFLTDAVEDIPNALAPDGRQTDVSYVSQCTAMKSAGVNVFTIWSTYPAIPNDPTRYDVLVKPLASQLPTTLQNCASSPSQYFQANDGPDITTAVNTTFNTIMNNSKLRISK